MIGTGREAVHLTDDHYADVRHVARYLGRPHWTVRGWARAGWVRTHPPRPVGLPDPFTDLRLAADLMVHIGDCARESAARPSRRRNVAA